MADQPVFELFMSPNRFPKVPLENSYLILFIDKSYLKTEPEKYQTRYPITVSLHLQIMTPCQRQISVPVAELIALISACQLAWS